MADEHSHQGGILEALQTDLDTGHG
jgi:hypothetical protein